MGSSHAAWVLPRAARQGLIHGLLLALGLFGSACVVPRWPVQAPVALPFAVLPEGSGGMHYGIDLLVPVGTEVGVMYGGQVLYAGELQGYGEAVRVDHGDGLESVYAHLSSIRVSEGQELGPGEIVGLSGRGPHTDDPHLHFEVWMDGRPIDPVRLLGGAPGR